MATILPFKAVRPTRDKVSLVASRSYQTYTQAEREARLDYNPFSFLHIVNPGYKYEREITGIERYKLVKNRYLEFKEDAIFIKDPQPCYYVYKIIDRNQQVFNGIIAKASALDYETNTIKKHEDTLLPRELVFKDYLKTVGFNAEPVLLTYEDNDSITNVIETVQQGRAEYEFTTTYRDTHYLWTIEDTPTISVIEGAFKKMPSLYIADGHHRTASSHLLYKDLKAQNPNHTGIEPYNFFMVFLIAQSNLKIHEYNRLIKDLNGHTKEEFLIELDTYFRIENRGKIPYKPSKKHHFSMYLDGAFYSLYLRKSHYNFTTVMDALDSQILYNTILNPILGIKDPRNDSRLQYVSGKKEIINVINPIDKNKFTVAFGMVPLTTSELKEVANNGLNMPPKSTYIEPKLRSGVTIYEF